MAFIECATRLWTTPMHLPLITGDCFSRCSIFKRTAACRVLVRSYKIAQAAHIRSTKGDRCIIVQLGSTVGVYRSAHPPMLNDERNHDCQDLLARCCNAVCACTIGISVRTARTTPWITQEKRHAKKNYIGRYKIYTRAVVKALDPRGHQKMV